MRALMPSRVCITVGYSWDFAVVVMVRGRTWSRSESLVGMEWNADIHVQRTSTPPAAYTVYSEHIVSCVRRGPAREWRPCPCPYGQMARCDYSRQSDILSGRGRRTTMAPQLHRPSSVVWDMAKTCEGGQTAMLVLVFRLYEWSENRGSRRWYLG
jgi:hypothetical protein